MQYTASVHSTIRVWGAGNAENFAAKAGTSGVLCAFEAAVQMYGKLPNAGGTKPPFGAVKCPGTNGPKFMDNEVMKIMDINIQKILDIYIKKV